MADHPSPKASGVHVNLLGPLVVTLDGRTVPLTGRQVPRLLSLLALRNGAPVPVETVIDVIWDEAPPAQAKRVALNLVGRMRQVIGSRSALTRQGAVSLVDVATDLDRFNALRSDASLRQRERDAAGERECLSAALRLVRGTPLADWADDPFFDAESAHLQRSIDRTRLRAAQLALDAGDHDAASDGAEAVLARDPLSQQALGIAMAALAGAGRIHEALTVYQDAKEQLAEATGLDPDPALTALYTDILRTDTGTDADPRPEPGPVPRQLPAVPDLASVHPRERSRASSELSVQDRTAPATVAVNGSGGIGKSAFAIDLAHSLQDHYPDGQLFANLHGNTPGHEPLSAGQVVRRFLRSLGTESEQWPDDDSAAAHFRSVTADLRILIVLDDVRDADQIRPLLPNGPGCGVVITSRRAMPSIRGAVHLELKYLDHGASRSLFLSGVDHPLSAEDEAALDAVLDRCGGLPLALCIAAARFNAAEPGSLPAILESLSDGHLGLSGFDDGEHSLAASLAGSLKGLASTPVGAQAAELFTVMALHPGPTIPVEIAAAMLDLPASTVRHLGELLRRYRLAELRDGELWMHDLVRLFAVNETMSLDRVVTTAVTGRMWNAYLGIAAFAYECFRDYVQKAKGRNCLDFLTDRPASPIDFASSQEVDEWLIAHLPVLTELVRNVGETDRQSPGLLYMLMGPPVRTRLGMAEELAKIGTAASEAFGDDDAPWAVYLHHDTASMNSRLGDHDSAIVGLGKAERSARRNGRVAEAIGVKGTLVRVLKRSGKMDEALELADAAIAEARQRDFPDIAERIGAFRSRLLDLRGEHEAAIEQSAELAAVAEDETADIEPLRRATHLINHAFRLVHGGRAAEGLEAAVKAQAILTEQGYDRSYTYAEILCGQAEAHEALGRTAESDDLWKHAAELMLEGGRIQRAQYEAILAGDRPAIDPAD